jgi:hypothetical protein
VQNIYELDEDGNYIAQMCFGPPGNYAMGDVLMSQKILLEQNEELALKIANRWERPAGIPVHGVAAPPPLCDGEMHYS